MKTPLSTLVARSYANVSLFLGAYAPLALLFAMRLFGKSHPVKGWACVGLFVVMAVNMLVMLRINRESPNEYVADRVESGGAELAAFVATYLLPFVVVGDVNDWDLAAYATYFLIIGIICVRGDLLHFNPLLAIRGYRLYTITTAKGRRWLVLSLERIRVGDKIDARALSRGALLAIKNRSALERNPQSS